MARERHDGEPRLSRVVLRMLQGAVLSAGAPLGWLLVQRARGSAPVAELTGDPGLYLYLFVPTLVVFTLFGLLLGRSEERLEAQGREFATLALTDALTGLHNRRYFDQRLREEWARSRREGSELSLVILDIDRFKEVNDQLGHPVGDEVLRSLGEAMRVATRGGESTARVGGEEFAALFPDTDLQGAAQAAQRYRAAIGRLVTERAVLPAGWKLSLSAGVATAPAGAEVSVEDLIGAADQALYRAKQRGRDRVEVAEGLEARSLPHGVGTR